MLFDLCPCSFDDVTVLHARRTGGLTRAAIQAAIDVCNERLADRQPAGIDLQYLVDTPAWRVHFHAQHPIRRAMVQTKPAMHAGGVEIPRRPVGTGEVRLAHFECVAVTLMRADLLPAHPTRNRPRFSMPFGSSACFTFRISGRSVGVDP